MQKSTEARGIAPHRKKAMAVVAVSLFLIVVDRVLKSFSIAGVSWLATFYNRRIAFSLPVSWSLGLSIAVAAILVFVIRAMVRDVRRQAYVRASVWFGLLLGATSNLYDRLIHGAVIDYIRIGTGYFNIADVMIGAALCVLMLMDRRTS